MCISFLSAAKVARATGADPQQHAQQNSRQGQSNYLCDIYAVHAQQNSRQGHFNYMCDMYAVHAQRASARYGGIHLSAPPLNI